MKVFLSSTCYDLADLRAEVEKFLMDKGHQLLLSDRANFQVEASKHRHDVCVENVAHADLLILVLDSRYGAPYYKDDTISITWAEFRKAIEENRKIIAFVRRDIFNERQSCRHNQKLGNNYSPFFADNIKTFDFIDEIQKNEDGIWIEIFENSVQVKERLDNLHETQHSVINEEVIEIQTIDNHVPLTQVSGSTASYITNYITDDSVEYIDKEIAEKAIGSLPEKTGVWGEILGFEQVPGPNDYYYFQPLRHSGDEGEIIVGISPTALGKSVRKELEDILKSINENEQKSG